MQNANLHLAVVCPRCKNQYQVDPSLKGRPMRCPNTICRAVFVVGDESPNPPPTKPNPPTVEATQEPSKQEAPSWESAPPPVRQPRAIEPAPPEPDQTDQDKSSDAPAGLDWQAAPPPVRRGRESEPSDPGADADEPSADIRDANPKSTEVRGIDARRKKKRGSLGIIAFLLLLLAGGGAWGYWKIRSAERETEAQRFERAQELLKGHAFAESADSFQKLHRDYPDSDKRPLYIFLAEWSGVKDTVFARHDQVEQLTDAAQQLGQFLNDRREDPLVKNLGGDLWTTLSRLSNDLLEAAQEKSQPRLLELARRSWKETSKVPPPQGTDVAGLNRKMDEAFSTLEKTLAERFARQDAFAALREMASRPSAEQVFLAQKFLVDRQLSKDAEALKVVDSIRVGHQAKIRFTKTGKKAEMGNVAIDPPLLTVLPWLHKPEEKSLSNSLVFSLARGVLYAFESGSGELRWARRIGVDAQTLPIVLPDRLVVLSCDPSGVLSLDPNTGDAIWRQPLADLPAGPPVLLGQSLLVATRSGRVEEIDLRDGTNVGHYDLGQPLSLGGIAAESSPIVYFPADNLAIYAIEPYQRICSAIEYTGHAVGSLRTTPTYIPDLNDVTHGWLALVQSAPQDQTRIHLLPTPFGEEPGKVHQNLAIAGSAWLPGYRDGVRFGLVTDAGIAAVFGIAQRSSRDPPLFAATPEFWKASGPSARGQFVHGNAENLWVSAQGKLQRLEQFFSDAKGPRWLPSWRQALDLGVPLQSGQWLDGPGLGMLFLTTQDQQAPICRASLIDCETGKIRWQRQLGVISQGPFVKSGLLEDAQGLLAFDLDKLDSKPAQEILVQQWEGKPTGRESFIIEWNGDLFRMSCDGKGHLEWSSLSQQKGNASRVTLPAPLQGRPIAGQDVLILPLANGILYRVTWKDDKTTVNAGPAWRFPGAEDGALGFLTRLEEGSFLASDGSRGIAKFQWADGAKTWDKQAFLVLPHRLIVPPTAWRDRVLLADASGTLTLASADQLKIERSWPLPGILTAGPFPAGDGIACIIGGDRLAYIDPAQDGIVWEYAVGAGLVGAPLKVGNGLLIADVAGRHWTLDVATGQPLGPPRRFEANICPAQSPLIRGDRLLMPLTDGTFTTLPVK